MEKLRFVDDAALYAPPADRFVDVDVPELPFLMIDGRGAPEGAEYAAAVAALYKVSFGLKFGSRVRLRIDYAVGPLEGLWWTQPESAFATTPREQWQWTMMIRQPDWIESADVEAGIQRALPKMPAVVDLRLVRWREGRSVQILHVGPYADETATIERLHGEYLPEHGLVPNGHHHEIYLSDPRRAAPANWRTILRQPVAPTPSAEAAVNGF
jgi:hypothetical protein